MTTTTDLSKFGLLELKKLELLLKAYREQGLPENFSSNEVVPTFNMSSGYVFLTNDEYQAALLTDEGKLEIWHYCSNCGHEGFLADFEHDPIDDECIAQMQWAAIDKYKEEA
jgi:hypothetical protein